MFEEVRCPLCGFHNEVHADHAALALVCDHCGDSLTIPNECLDRLQKARQQRSETERNMAVKSDSSDFQAVGIHVWMVASLLLTAYGVFAVWDHTEKSAAYERRRNRKIERVNELSEKADSLVRLKDRRYRYDPGFEPPPIEIPVRIRQGQLEGELAEEEANERTRATMDEYVAWSCVGLGLFFFAGSCLSRYRNSVTPNVEDKSGI